MRNIFYLGAPIHRLKAILNADSWICISLLKCHIHIYNGSEVQPANNTGQLNTYRGKFGGNHTHTCMNNT